jgi:hypothetical protein
MDPNQVNCRRPLASLGNAVRIAALAAVALSFGVITVGPSVGEQVSATPSTGTISIAIHGGQGAPDGVTPMVEVSVGSGAPVPVVLDTGSAGLQLFSPAVPSGDPGVHVTTGKDQITYAGGHRFTGVVADAVVTVGGQSTAAPVPFGLVQSASCLSSKPSCPAAGGMDALISRGSYGILGIAMSRGPDGLSSPLVGMASPLGQTWSIHLKGDAGTLQLGALVPTGADAAATFALSHDGGPNSAFWLDSRARACVTVGAASSCVPSLFDTGTAQMQVSGAPLDQAAPQPGTSRAQDGTPVSVSVVGTGAPFWTFVAGASKSADTVLLRTDGGPFVNFGVQGYFTFTITYDDMHGTITLSAPQTEPTTTTTEPAVSEATTGAGRPAVAAVDSTAGTPATAGTVATGTSIAPVAATPAFTG